MGNSGYQLLLHTGAVATGPAGEFSQPHLLGAASLAFRHLFFRCLALHRSLQTFTFVGFCQRNGWCFRGSDPSEWLEMGIIMCEHSQGRILTQQLLFICRLMSVNLVANL